MSSLDSFVSQFIKTIPPAINNPTINKNFIMTQALEYMQDPRNDEDEYQEIICCIQYEQRFDVNIFEKILIWKGKPNNRWKNHIKLSEFNTAYKPTIDKIINTKILEADYIKELKKIKGFGFPYASTVLHFIYPSKFPIIDARVVEVLYYYDYIETMSTGNLKEYNVFCKALDKIKNSTGCSFHCIDRALWHFDNLTIQKTLNEFYRELNHLINPSKRISKTAALDESNLRKLIIDLLKWGIRNARNGNLYSNPVLDSPDELGVCLTELTNNDNNSETVFNTSDGNIKGEWKDKIKKEFADKYISDDEERDLFLKATDFRQWANYIAGFLLTINNKAKEFTPKEARDTLLANTSIPPNYIEAKRLLTADVRVKAPNATSSFYPCLDKLDENKDLYVFVGFKEGIKRKLYL